MKKLVFIVFLIAFSSLKAQILPIDSVTKLVTYQGVETVSGKTKLEIYSALRGWVATAFKDSKSVIQMDDKDAGKIICVGNIPVSFLNRRNEPYMDAGIVKFELTILIKDGRYKYIFSNFFHEFKGRTSGNITYDCSGEKIENEKPACGTFSLSKSNWESIKQQIDEIAKKMIKNLHDSSLKINSVNDNF